MVLFFLFPHPNEIFPPPKIIKEKNWGGVPPTLPGRPPREKAFFWNFPCPPVMKKKKQRRNQNPFFFPQTNKQKLEKERGRKKKEKEKRNCPRGPFFINAQKKFKKPFPRGETGPKGRKTKFSYNEIPVVWKKKSEHSNPFFFKIFFF